jgi:hypothetical protein
MEKSMYVVSGWKEMVRWRWGKGYGCHEFETHTAYSKCNSLIILFFSFISGHSSKEIIVSLGTPIPFLTNKIDLILQNMNVFISFYGNYNIKSFYLTCTRFSGKKLEATPHCPCDMLIQSLEIKFLFSSSSLSCPFLPLLIYFFEAGSHYISQADLKLRIFLP